MQLVFSPKSTTASSPYKDAVRTFYSKFAVDYDRHMHETNHFASLERLVQLFSPSIKGSVLVPAARTGQAIIYILNHTRAKQVVGVDACPEMLEEARKKLGQHANLYLHDEEALPFPDSCFDTVFYANAFHWFEDKRLAASEASRVLAPKGRLIVIEEWPLLVTPSEVIEEHILNISKAKSEIHIQELLQLVKQATGLEMLEAERTAIDGRHSLYGFVFGRK